jgi:hypothetical protein
MENEKVYKPSLKYTIAVIGICIWASLALLCVGWTRTPNGVGQKYLTV